ncbi:MAG: hypothetical protein CMF30_05490 [Kiritimatiellaceae bacterium]|nr:hypothetical protein [Kiritimatiellaceae bacterium]
MKILVIDIGNTSTSLGVYSNKGITKSLKVLNPNDKKIKIYLDSLNIDTVAIASVVPIYNDLWTKKLSEANFQNIFWINHHHHIGVDINYPSPYEIGSDRLANAAAAAKWIGLPSIVCDFGTALTFDVIDKNKGYIGGIICPGPELMLNYLYEKTALLPNIKLKSCNENIGDSTSKAMYIGTTNGFKGMVLEIINGIKKDLNVRRLKLCATGGNAQWFLKNSNIKMEYMKHLTLLGIGYIYELNN